MPLFWFGFVQLNGMSSGLGHFHTLLRIVMLGHFGQTRSEHENRVIMVIT